MNRQANKAFTLVETIIVVTIIAIVLPLMFSIMYVILQQQVRLLQLNEVKKQGDFFLQYAESKVRNDSYNCVQETAPVTSPGGVHFMDSVNAQFTIDPAQVVPDTVTVTNFTLTCTTKTKADGGTTKPVVGISFQVTSRSNNQVLMRYNTKVQIRHTAP